jgi:hypothetical protein
LLNPIDPQVVEALRASQEQAGELEPVLVCLQHPDHIISGHHRAAAVGGLENVKKIEKIDVEAYTKKVGVPHEAGHELLILQSNVQRPHSMEESKDRVLRIARILESTGVPKEKILSKLAGLIYSASYLSKLLPDEYKQIDHARSKGRPRNSTVVNAHGLDFLRNQEPEEIGSLTTSTTVSSAYDAAYSTSKCSSCGKEFQVKELTLACKSCVRKMRRNRGKIANTSRTEKLNRGPPIFVDSRAPVESGSSVGKE